MDISDRELLELAAKASGRDDWDHSPYIAGDANGPVWWNPLDDDGDALRLAINLGMMVDTSCQPALILCAGPLGISLEESARVCKFAATRRAIVRVAAEIAKSMKGES
jgi:hypothetical protein